MDYPQFYKSISAPWRKLPRGASVLAWVDKILVGTIAAAFGVTLIWLVATGDIHWVPFALVPAIVLGLVTALRTCLQAPRPYEAYVIDLLLPPTGKGHSMPSRHVASAFAIATALGYINLAWGIIAGVAACLVAYVRVAGGLHFPRDVVAGAALALLCGSAGHELVVMIAYHVVAALH